MTDDITRPDALLPARAEHDPDAGTWTLVLVRDLRHGPDAVWGALTEPAQLACWAPFEADRDLAGEGAATLTVIDGEDRVATAATVTRSEPGRLLEYVWGGDRLRWELEALDGGTRLTLRHATADRGMLPKSAAGWHLCLAVLTRLLDGEPVTAVRGREAMAHGWEQLHRAYADRLGVPVTP